MTEQQQLIKLGPLISLTFLCKVAMMSTKSLTNYISCGVSTNMLPLDSSEVFHKSTYFAENGLGCTLPLPAIVRSNQKARFHRIL